LGKRKKTSPKSKTSLFPAGVGPAMSYIEYPYIKVGSFFREKPAWRTGLVFAGGTSKWNGMGKF
jgi:hypothetical protein